MALSFVQHYPDPIRQPTNAKFNRRVSLFSHFDTLTFDFLLLLWFGNAEKENKNNNTQSQRTHFKEMHTTALAQ
jgi:hypothetical protein